MNEKEMWAKYLKETGAEDGPYEAWAFGDDADALAALVLEGKKTATSSAFDLYALEGDMIPAAGDRSVVLNSREEAVCVIENLSVTVLPYHEVTEEMAALEGEGDRSLAYWRQVHERFFRAEMQDAGLSFHERMPVVFERFRVVWSVKNR